MKKFLAAILLTAFGFSAPSYVLAEVAHISGGISEEGRAELMQTSQNYNLKLVFALVGGAYLSDIKVAIQNRQGAPVFEGVSSGPWMFVQLPPGKYTITATNRDQSLQKSARVRASGQTKVNFYWPSE